MNYEHFIDGYKIIENYRENEFLRNKFLEFVSQVFPGLSFSEWTSKGYWTDNYIPHSLIFNNKIISNVAISKMSILLNNKLMDGIQIGTVGTLPEYRKRGLSRLLMNYVLKKYSSESKFVYLFANNSVLDFYPKFGFKRYNHYLFVAESHLPVGNFLARKLNLNSESDFQIIQSMLDTRLPITELFGAKDYKSITMWYIFNFFRDSLYYLEDINVIFIIEQKENKLHIYDIIFSNSFDLNSAISRVIQNDVEAIIYYFSPDYLKYKYDRIIPNSDSPLFVKGDFEVQDKIFKYPETAQT